MNASTTSSPPADLVSIRRQIDTMLADFVAAKARAATATRLPVDLAEAVREFLSAGGKRIRPLLCVLGWLAAGGSPDIPESVLRAAGALEMFHAAVLIHDDIIDSSDTRRDRPTAHRALAVRHQTRSDADCFGEHAAILLGDLAFIWSGELLHTAGLTPRMLTAALSVLDAMRGDVQYGQYLDLLATGHPDADLDRALQIIRYKTVAYTCQRPLQLGAALADAAPEVHAALLAYASPLGEAFQLRDDLLGVFGDPAVSGKSSADDLRDGKHSALIAIAFARADAAQAAQLRALLGNPELDEKAAAHCRAIIAATGAATEIGRMIAGRRDLALAALDARPLPPSASNALRAMAIRITAIDTSSVTAAHPAEIRQPEGVKP
ncbi:polyprenyl synthetase family protein [Nocardia sp. NPDC046473]|uniref:polyprenyl synthetase family protein n=1 Tax=Nocardia sp. NPDC046473 TaxID=3155733 RepID=UPI0033D87358